MKLVDDAYKAAESKIIEAANAIGYEETCKDNARALLTAMFGELSGKKIVIEFKENVLNDLYQKDTGKLFKRDDGERKPNDGKHKLDDGERKTNDGEQKVDAGEHKRGDREQ